MKKLRSGRQAGNAIVMLFAAIGMAGVVTYGLNNVVRGPGVTTAEVSRKTMAENNLIASTRLAISSAVTSQQRGGDCDADGFVEPLPYRDAGTAPKPTGGGLIPMTMGASVADPWGVQYGYCVWDPGTASVSNAVPDCGGATPRRLQGAPRDDQFAIAIISAGKNGAFETSCNAYVDTTPADGKPDTAMINKPLGSDDIVLAYTYAEANGIGGGEWKLKETAGVIDANTAAISKDLEVAGGATFTDGALKLTGDRGLVLPGDPGNDTVTGPCNANKEKQLRRNIGDGSAVPIIEVCHNNAWVAVTGGTTIEEQCEPAYTTWANSDSSREWWGIASSADGMNLFAVENTGRLYTSTNGGISWTPRESARLWKFAASSTDGTKLVVTGNATQIYTSADSGATWTARDSVRDWWGVASSADGTKLAAVARAGQIYTSTNSGAAWTARASGSRNWFDITSSADGTRLSATVTGGQIYTSTDSGVTWTARASVRDWWGIDMSANGTIQAAVVSNGYIYISTDSGVTWTQKGSSLDWRYITMSDDGTKMAATRHNGQIYTSLDMGETWTEQPSGSNIWRGIAMSADGSKIFAAPFTSQIKISDDGCGSGGGGGGGPACTTGPIGTVCADGAIYVGDVGGVRRFAKATDSASGADLQWKTSTTSTDGTTSTTDGAVNTAVIAGFGGNASHPAGEACIAHGADWYLPARDEVTLMYTNKAAASLSIAGWHWSSTQGGSGNSYVHSREMTAGSTSTLLKTEAYKVRCMRKTIASDSTSGGGGGGTERIAFITSANYSGNLGGTAGADAKCNALATAAGLPGTYMAWIADGSNSTTAPASRFEKSTVPYKTVTGVKIADNWADLTDGTLDAPLNITQTGTTSGGGTWTNVRADGTPVGSNHCNKWGTSSSGMNGRTGAGGESDAEWATESNKPCSYTKQLYCFQQEGGGGNEVATCGETWTLRTAAQNNSWKHVMYQNGLFVAVSVGGSSRVMTSPDGITWTSRTAAAANSWQWTTYGNGLFVSVSTDGTNRVMTSPDAITWTSRTAPTRAWRSITYGNGTFVAVSSDAGNNVMTSPDGITWTQRAGVGQEWRAVTYGNGMFLAVGAAGSNRAMTSPDGITWTPRTVPLNNWQGVTYGNGLFVAVTDGVMTSPDGVTWTTRTLGTSATLNSVVWTGSKFAAVGHQDTNRLVTSVDGITWTPMPESQGNEWTAITHGNNTLVAVSIDGPNRVLTSNCPVDKNNEDPDSAKPTPHPLDVDLIAHWKMEEGTGTAVADSIGGNDGTFVNTPVWIQGVNGEGALSFSKDDRDAVQINGIFDKPETLTIAGWVNINSTDTSGAEILSLGNAVNLRLNPAGALQLAYNFGPGNWQYATSSNIVAGSGWRYVVGTLDDPANIFRVYVDGQLVGEQNYTQPVLWNCCASNSFIGRHGESSVDYDANGGIDDLRLYNRALGPGEVASLYEREKARSQARDVAPVAATDKIKPSAISMFGDHACVVNKDQSAWCWGRGQHGLMGRTTDENAETPIRLGNDLWNSISNGRNHSCGIKTDGSAWCWGYGGDGARGDGTTTSGPTPAQVSGTGPWTAVSTGHSHSCGIKFDGTAWCWGNGAGGRLGNGGTATSNVPVQVSGTGTWASIVVGTEATCGTKSDGSAWCWGLGTSGKLGNGATTQQTSPVEVAGRKKWTDISTTSDHACGIQSDGSAWCWGAGAFGRLGDGISTTDQLLPVRVSNAGPWASISAIASSTCAIRIDGSAWCWGLDNDGQLGNGADGSSPIPVQLHGGGAWTALTRGYNSICGLRADGTVLCWGGEGNGNLGNGPAGAQTTPGYVTGIPGTAPLVWNTAHTALSVNANTTLALGNNWLSDDGTAKYFGFSAPGQATLLQNGIANQLLVQTAASSSSAQLSFRRNDRSEANADYTTGRVAEWLFSETAGTTAASSVGSFPGTVSGTTSWSLSSGQGVLELETDGRVSVARSAALEPATLTVSFWVRPDGAQAGSATVLSKAHTNNTGAVKQSYGFEFTADGKLSFITGFTGGNDTLTSAIPVRLNGWTHVMGVYAPGAATPQKKIYLNGELQGSKTLTNPLVYDTAASGNLFFGSAGCTAACQSYFGAIDTVRIYNTALTDKQVANLYAYYSATTSTAQSIGIDTGTNALEIGRNNAAGTNWLNTITPDVSLTAAGRLGIGTITPAASVDVAGSVRVGYQNACSAAGMIRYKGNARDDGGEEGGGGEEETCDASTWTTSPLTQANDWSAITYGNGMFVGVAATGTNRIATSPDGTTWTLRSVGANQWSGITYANGLFVAVANYAGQGMGRVATSPDGITWTSRTTVSQQYSSIAYGGGLFAAVSWDGGTTRAMTSPDGITWTLRTTPALQWNAITYGAGKFVAVGPEGARVMTSTDGVTWTAGSGMDPYTWNSVTYGEGLFVAVGSTDLGGGAIMTSPDGITWTARTGLPGTWRSVTYGSGTFVAVANTGTNRIMKSPDGITWTAATAPETNGWYGVTYGGGKFAAIAMSGTNRVMLSSCGGGGGSSCAGATVGGACWFLGNSAASCTATCAAAGGTYDTATMSYAGSGGTNANCASVLTALGVSGSGASTQADGAVGCGHYTSGNIRLHSNSPATTEGATLANMKRACACSGTGGGGGGGGTCTGTTWTWADGGAGMPIQTLSPTFLEAGGKVVMLPGQLAKQGAYTTDGTTWTTTSGVPSATWASIAYGASTYVGVASSGTSRVTTSSDGIAWTARTASQANPWNDVAFGNSTFVAVASGGTNRVMTSANGITWTNRTASQANPWSSVAYGNGLFVAVASTGTNRVMTSPDGITWTNRTAAAAQPWYRVTYANNLFVAVGSTLMGAGQIMTSPDGITWTTRTGTLGVYTGITYGNGYFVAYETYASGGSASRMGLSTDGITWTAATSPVGGADDMTFGLGYGLGKFYMYTNDNAISANFFHHTTCGATGGGGGGGGGSPVWTMPTTNNLCHLVPIWGGAGSAGPDAPCGPACTTQVAGQACSTLGQKCSFWEPGEGAEEFHYNLTCAASGGGGGTIDTPFQFCDGTDWQPMGLATLEDVEDPGFFAARKSGAVEGSGGFSCAINNVGNLYCWGYMDSGRLGIGPIATDQWIPVKVGTATWLRVADNASARHNCAIQSNGTLWCWGDNENGQVGDGTFTDRDRPLQIGADLWSNVTAGARHTCAIRNNGTLWCWGAAEYGKLGINSTTPDRTSPVQVGADAWIKVTAASNHTCGIRDNGTLWCWGYSGQGQVGDGTTTQRNTPRQVGSALWIDVHATENSTCGLRQDGVALCWGYNNMGQIGDGSTNNRTSPVAVSGGGTWTQIDAGAIHTCGIKNNGTLWCWGWNDRGQIGDGTTTNRPAPAQVGTDTWFSVAGMSGHTCATKLDGSLWCWGAAEWGRLGNDSETPNQLTPVKVHSGVDGDGVGGGASCSLDGQVVLDGASYTFYSTNTDANCAGVSQSRTCNDGTLGGSATYQYATCAPPFVCSPGGVEVGGNCWYLGANLASCTTTCASRGGYNNATNTYAGVGGQQANCWAVMDALGVAGTNNYTTTGCHSSIQAVGCYAYANTAAGPVQFRSLCSDSNATAGGAGANSGRWRACACNN